MTLAAPATALAAPTEPVAQVETTAATKTPAPAQQQDSSSYAQREQADHKVADYEGGAVVVYLSGAALVAIILILLLL